MAQKIAILGATGYIGKSLLAEYALQNNPNTQVCAFSRDVKRLQDTIKSIVPLPESTIQSFHISELANDYYDVIINATGAGDTRILKAEPARIFAITESVDSQVIASLEQYPDTLYINLSSGAVYGDNFQAPIVEETKATFAINNFKLSEYYSIAKLHTEAKHRALSHLKITDLRVFAFFSRFAEPKAEFLLSEIVDCLQTHTVLKTNGTDIVRDYITPVDLYQLIQCVISAPRNVAYDVYSQEPVTKFTLLDAVREKYGLEYDILSDHIRGGDKFSKNIYFSKNHQAALIGYRPKYSSLQGVIAELSQISFP